MTDKQAVAEARRRWGSVAIVERRKSSRYRTGTCTACLNKDCKSRRHQYQVGRVAMGMFFEILGCGHSWEEAFAYADKYKR